MRHEFSGIVPRVTTIFSDFEAFFLVVGDGVFVVEISTMKTGQRNVLKNFQTFSGVFKHNPRPDDRVSEAQMSGEKVKRLFFEEAFSSFAAKFYDREELLKRSLSHFH